LIEIQFFMILIYYFVSVESPNQVKITDFGLAKLVSENEEHKFTGGKVGLLILTKQTTLLVI